ncbi:nitrate/nitrite transporter NrtS [Agarilytica rhodophyticola]|uniref:nitrate/nitrite transporter NrtS n=1 Tax=Agarilytica rhodophyticola TaxID=1737490 RepID=UPI000B348F87|nr:nitrate/nitrite transporter NrtS [Agarilytica rhodophyticola]
MSEQDQLDQKKRAIQMRSLKVALVVGTILGTVNYADKIYLSNMSVIDWTKFAITYAVPYCVSLFSGLSALKEK